MRFAKGEPTDDQAEDLDPLLLLRMSQFVHQAEAEGICMRGSLAMEGLGELLDSELVK